jgi:predicted nucleic acid-binding Zn ribbon protein
MHNKNSMKHDRHPLGVTHKGSSWGITEDREKGSKRYAA